MNSIKLPFQIVAIGTTNQTKVGAVEMVVPSTRIVSLTVPSGVSAQPLSNSETLAGAKNRAENALQASPDAEIGIGLEGGVEPREEGLFLCNWGALTDGKTVFIAGGARIPLPAHFLPDLQNGVELSTLMDAYAAKQDVGNKEGAVGVLTNGWLNRKEMFGQIVQMLIGQYLHYYEHPHNL